MEVIPISFKSAGKKIAAILEIPEESNPPAVIYSHGFTSSGTMEWTPDSTHKVVNTAARLRQLGFLVLRFDFRGLGKSEGEFMEDGINGEVKDLMAAVDFVKDRGCEEISFLGSSLGGAVSILNYDYAKPRSMVLWNPVTDLGAFSLPYGGHSEKEIRAVVKAGGSIEITDDGKKYVLGKSFLKELIDIKEGIRGDLDVQRTLTEIECPTLIIHGNKDEVLPIEKCREDFKRIPANIKEFVEVKGAGHGFLPTGSEYEQKAIKATIRWFDKYGR